MSMKRSRPTRSSPEHPHGLSNDGTNIIVSKEGSIARIRDTPMSLSLREAGGEDLVLMVERSTPTLVIWRSSAKHSSTQALKHSSHFVSQYCFRGSAVPLWSPEHVGRWVIISASTVVMVVLVVPVPIPARHVPSSRLPGRRGSHGRWDNANTGGISIKRITVIGMATDTRFSWASLATLPGLFEPRRLATMMHAFIQQP